MTNEIDLDHYVPSAEQLDQAKELRDFLNQCYEKGLRISLIGGYGLDALYQKLTRDHKDFDFLVDAGSRDEVVAVVLARGYQAVSDQFDSRRKKEAYSLPGAGYQIEFVVVDPLMLGYMAQQFRFSPRMELFMPDEFNGRLLDLAVRVPEVEGIEIIDRVQQHTAAEKGWKEYRHTAHREQLIKNLKQKKSSG